MLSIFILIAILILLVWVSYLQYRLYRAKRASKDLWREAKGSNLEEILDSQNKYLQKNSGKIKDLREYAQILEKRIGFTIQKVKVIRYDAFPGEGGEQSFSIALLDQKQNGLVLTNLHSREQDRIYAKPVREGKSPYHLTKEELRAIQN